MTNDEELLVVLKNEMLLTRARAFGAKETKSSAWRRIETSSRISLVSYSTR